MACNGRKIIGWWFLRRRVSCTTCFGLHWVSDPKVLVQKLVPRLGLWFGTLILSYRSAPSPASASRGVHLPGVAAAVHAQPQTDVPVWRQQSSSLGLLCGWLRCRSLRLVEFGVFSYAAYGFPSPQQKNGESSECVANVRFVAARLIAAGAPSFCVARQLHTGAALPSRTLRRAAADNRCVQSTVYNACRAQARRGSAVRTAAVCLP